jgi:hypothetical protein
MASWPSINAHSLSTSKYSSSGCDLQRFLEVRSRIRVVADVRIDLPEVQQADRLADRISDLAEDRHRLGFQAARDRCLADV